MATQSVRLVDVARAAQVSPATVSQVLNGSGRLSAQTRRHVVETAERLGYRPNALARSVAMGRSRTIGVLAENAAGAFCMPVLIGITRELSENDLASVLFDAAHDPDLRRVHVRHMVDRQVDGIIVIGEGSDLAIAPLGERFDGPVVHAFGPANGAGVETVSPDDRAGGALAAQRLLEMGRSNIAHVTAARALPSVAARRAGFEEQLEEAGLTPSAVLHGEFSRAWGITAAAQLLAQAPDTDAVFAGNDAIAIGLASQLEALGRRVPDDIAIIGFDNLAGYSEDEDPYLESIDPRLMDVGHAAASRLLALLSGTAEAKAASVSPVLVPGATTRGDRDPERRRVMEALLRSTAPPPVAAAPYGRASVPRR